MPTFSAKVLHQMTAIWAFFALPDMALPLHCLVSAHAKPTIISILDRSLILFKFKIEGRCSITCCPYQKYASQ